MNWLQGRTRNTWRTLSSLLAVGGLLLLYFGTQKRITLVLNGEELTMMTHARTVTALLATMDIIPEVGDEIYPALKDVLKNNQTVIYTMSSAIVVDDEGLIHAERTTQTMPENILQEIGSSIFPGDSLEIYPFHSTSREPFTLDLNRWLRIKRGVPIQLNLDGTEIRFSSSAATLAEALWERGITIREGDILEPHGATVLGDGLEVTLSRSGRYTINVDGQKLERTSAGATVGDILANAGIALVGLDYTIPDIQAPPPESGEIRVVRVLEELLVELEPIEFETVYQPADQLELDTLEVLEPGTFGVESNTIRIRYEDGVEVSRKTEEAVTAIEPNNRVIGYGTKIVVRTIDTGSGTIEYWRAIPIYATSYSPCNLGVPWCGTLTASGKGVDRGIIGVIRSWYNLMRGWSVFVPGYGPGTFEDIGAGIAGRDWIDLGFTDENFEPWHQWTTLYFLTPVPPLDSIPWILP